MHRELKHFLCVCRKGIFHFPFLKYFPKIPQKSANHSSYFCFDDETKHEQCVPGKQFDIHTPGFTEYLTIKTSASIAPVSGGSEVRLPEITLLGSARCRWGMRSQPGCPSGLPHPAAGTHTQSTHSPSQEGFSPDLMLSKTYQCFHSCIYAVKATNLIDLWPQRRKISFFPDTSEYLWSIQVVYRTVLPSTLVWSGQRCWWISASSTGFQHGFTKKLLEIDNFNWNSSIQSIIPFFQPRFSLTSPTTLVSDSSALFTPLQRLRMAMVPIMQL